MLSLPEMFFSLFISYELVLKKLKEYLEEKISVTIAINSTSLKATVTAATIAVITKTSVVVVIPVYFVFSSKFLMEPTNFNSSMRVTFYFKQI